MRVDIDMRLNKLYANCVNFQVINVQLAQSKEEALIKTQVAVQQAKTKKKEQKAKEIRSSIQVMQSLAQKNITEVKGRGSGQAKIIMAQATSEASQMVIEKTADAYKELNDKCQFNPQNKLDEFIYLADLQSADNINVMYNVERAIVDLSKGKKGL